MGRQKSATTAAEKENCSRQQELHQADREESRRGLQVAESKVKDLQQGQKHPHNRIIPLRFWQHFLRETDLTPGFTSLSSPWLSICASSERTKGHYQTYIRIACLYVGILCLTKLVPNFCSFAYWWSCFYNKEMWRAFLGTEVHESRCSYRLFVFGLLSDKGKLPQLGFPLSLTGAEKIRCYCFSSYI